MLLMWIMRIVTLVLVFAFQIQFADAERCRRTSLTEIPEPDLLLLQPTRTHPRYSCYSTELLDNVVVRLRPYKRRNRRYVKMVNVACEVQRLDKRLDRLNRIFKKNGGVVWPVMKLVRRRSERRKKLMQDLASECDIQTTSPDISDPVDPKDIYQPGPLPVTPSVPTLAPTESPTPTGTATALPSTPVPSAVPTLTSTVVPVEPTVSALPEDQRIISEGINAFRSPDIVFPRVNCTGCHAPDAFDLAMLDISEQDIIRRAEPHIGAAKGQQVALLIEAVRRKYGISRPFDRKNFRPFQPGGEVLAGLTTLDKDLEFMRRLETVYQLRAAKPEPIKTLAEAVAIRDEMLAIDLTQMKIGIPLNRWVEDKFHGKEHYTLSDWVPDLPFVPKSGQEATQVQLQDTYIDDPSDRNFALLYDFLIDNTEPVLSGTGGLESLAQHKRNSNFLGQHFLRKAQLQGLPHYRSFAQGQFNSIGEWLIPLMEQHGTKRTWRKAGHIANPFWAVGDIARVAEQPGKRCAESNDAACFNVSQEMWDDITGAHTFRDQMRAIKLPWFWLGWIWDQGLQRSSGSNSTKSAEYMLGAMHLESFPQVPYDDSTKGFHGHRTFMFFRKAMTQAFISTSHEDAENTRMMPTLGYFYGYQRDKRSVSIPREQGATELANRVEHLMTNFYLTNAFLLENELKVLGTLNGRADEKNRQRYISQIRLYREWFAIVGGQAEQTAKPLLDNIEAMVAELPGD